MGYVTLIITETQFWELLSILDRSGYKWFGSFLKHCVKKEK